MNDDELIAKYGGKIKGSSGADDALIAKYGGKIKQQEYDPTEGMSNFDKFAAGMGKAFVDLGRGAGQLVGAIDREDVEASRKTDAALMKTGAGQFGNFAGAAVPAVATMMIPGINSYTGAMAAGAGLGLLQPSTSTGETLANVGLGGAGGAGGQFIGNQITNVARAAKAAAEPFYKEGQDAIIGRMLAKSAGGDMQTVRGQLANAPQYVPGSMPTVGQAAPALAPLERTVTQMEPTANVAYQARMAEQDVARRAVLDQFSDPAQREFFDASRQTAAKELYDRAFAEAPTESAWIKGQFTQLTKRPAFEEALRGAQVRAANEGVALNPENQTQIAHYAKMELDAMISKAQRSGDNVNGLIDTRNRLVSVMESKDFSPSYREARSTYAAMSKPLNEIDTAAAIREASLGKLQENIRPEAFGRAFNDQTARKATGFNGATLENSLSPEALAAFQGLKSDLQRSVSSQTAGRGPGSDTVQKLAYSNFIDAAGVPTFLRNMTPVQFGGNILARGADALYAGKNKEISNRLAATMLDPQEAEQLMAMGQMYGQNSPVLSNYLRTLMLSIRPDSRNAPQQ